MTDEDIKRVCNIIKVLFVNKETNRETASISGVVVDAD
jgi:hypothetical protein